MSGERLDGLARVLFGLDVDVRLRVLWEAVPELLELEEEDARSIATQAARAGYAIGYCAAFRELGGDPDASELMREYQARHEEADS